MVCSVPELLFGSILDAGITAQSFFICLAAALVLGVLVAGVYMFKNTYTQSMAVTLALIPALVQVIILLVNGNIGAGVAVSGAFSLVRFRSAAGSARDITCIFLAMTLGLATGMGYIGVAVVTGLAVCLLLVAYSVLSFGKKLPVEKELKITIPENLDYTGLFDDLFAEYTSGYTEDDVLKEKYYQRQFLPQFEALKSSIVNGLLPEMDAMRSLDDFIQLYESCGKLFGEPIRHYDISHTYFPFISGVHGASGKKRMELILSEMGGTWLPTLPKIVKKYLESHMGGMDTDSEADRIFHAYCNQVRIAYKLDVK